MKTITLPNNLRKIGYRAFYACTHLEEVNYVGQVTVAGGILESSAFEGCESLTKIILPQSISELQEGVFMECIYNHRTTKTNQKYPSVNL